MLILGIDPGLRLTGYGLVSLTRGKITLKKVDLNLGVALRASIRATRSAFEKRGQRFSVALPEEPVWVQVDPDRLEQIVSNLLINASKFTEPGKQISVSLESEGAHAVLRVCDEGVGIPPGMQEHIFEPFVQVEESHSPSGLGLGLPLVRQLARLHRGSVEVRSEGVGCGSEFIVRLPLIPEPNPATVVESEETGIEQTHAESHVIHRVLLVEDNLDLGKTMNQLLSRWGYEVRLVSSGSAALEKALEFIPNVAIIDIGLPEMDGYAVAECLSSAQALSGMRLIAMSGYGEDGDRARAVQSGFHDFLLKPVEPARLRSTLEGR